MRIAVSAALALTLLGAAGAQAQLLRDSGWCVVVASPPDLPPAQADAKRREILARMRVCGLKPYYDFSSKFSGFRPGLMVYVLGAYATRAEADYVREAASACSPAAYVKQGRYAGE
jgi:hypothetical protein